MPTSADVVVVGAGLFGASVAYQLTRGGAGRVLLLDQAMPASGDSGRTVGMVRHHYSNDVTAQLAIRGGQAIRDWSDVVGVADAGFVRSGFMLAVPEERLEACIGNVRRLQRLGLNTRFVTPDEISDIEPLISLEGVAGGAYEPDGGFANSYLMILGWITAAASMGMEARFGVSVDSLVVRHGKVAGVRTSCGVIEAGTVVIASGAWARPMLAEVGWEPPIRLRRLEVSVWKVPAGQLIPQVVCSDGVSGLVVRPDRANEFLAVAYSPERPADVLGDYDYTISNKHDQVLRERFRLRFPSLTNARPLRGWAGPYDFTPDWHPIVGAIPGIDGLYASVGTSGHGFKLAPSIGECLAAQILGQESPVDISQLAADRFIDGTSTLELAYGPSARA
ncbi:MAG TPA: FAD-binding oxidoreductase [Nocardioides sp.]|uniref:NAD(P)/FAD-dependent oxidoreductase n=1 Tax=uncultured Nocardioides sp. TaxID=198441 RepID=UPI00262A0514|nr:FAD-binding oxidoreductase [uncultured Nocardioides sp.]HRI94363.1 FAD-binding oxidoreductase [Nocardioides sp.]HRK44293.1 FAD-binding oxidoreductase [Nocardioides sp.]